MLRVLGLAVTAVLLLGITSCTSQTQNNDSARKTSTVTTMPTATPTAAPVPTAPTTATVTTPGITWREAASGSPVTTIKVGGTVTWKISGAPHRLAKVAGTPENGCGELGDDFNSPTITEGSVTRKFDKEGIYGYQCGIHKGTPNCKNPPGNGPMPGVIKVVP